MLLSNRVTGTQNQRKKQHKKLSRLGCPWDPSKKFGKKLRSVYTECPTESLHKQQLGAFITVALTGSGVQWYSSAEISTFSIHMVVEL